MGTRRLHVALLLAVLQFSAVVRGEGNNPNPCTQCSAAPPKATCDASNVCEPSQGTGDLVSGTAPGCKTLTCAVPELLLIEPPLPAGSAVKEITCDSTSKWISAVGAVAKASCIQGFHCYTKTPLKTVCDGTPTTAGCKEMDLMKDDILTCDTGKVLFFNNAGMWELVVSITCDMQTGVWIRDSIPMQADDVVICADRNPDDCEPLETASQAASWCQGIATCTPPTGTVSAACAADNLYFVQTPHTIWMAAKSIDCVSAAKWQVTFEFGKMDDGTERLKTKEFSLVDDKVICAATDPTPAGKHCKIKPGADKQHFDYEPGTRTVNAGQAGQCADNTIFEIYFASENLALPRGLQGSVLPVCNADGQWETSDNQARGDTFACRNHKCRKCPQSLPEVPRESFMHVESGGNQLEKETSGECMVLECKQNKMAVHDLDEGIYRYSIQELKCDADGVSYKDSEQATIDQALCIQKLYCIETNYAKVTLSCPAEAVNFGCKEAVLQDASGQAETLTCDEGLQMYIRNDRNQEKYWVENKNPTITCNPEYGRWEVDTVVPEEKYRRDWRHTIICASGNPQPKSTTTTAATTTEPLRPICEVCGELLKDLFKFDACTDCKNVNETDLTSLATEGKPADGDQCALKLKDKKREIIINSYEQVDTLLCRRISGNNVRWMNGDMPVDKLASRPTTKKGEWRLMSYVVIAVVFVAIGGMGIGCVVIYMKMRKQPSSREKKKKERGVTKKYTSSNVVKTSNKTAGASKEGTSKEGGKSKQSSSKMDNEDAPTLKL